MLAIFYLATPIGLLRKDPVPLDLGPQKLLSLLEKVQLAAGAGFLSLTEAVETTTAAGRMMMQMVGAGPS